MKMVRTRQHVQRDQFDHYIVSVRRSGPVRVDAEGARRDLGLMQPLLTDMSRPSTAQGEPLGGVVRYIRERRLAHCHAILSKPGPRRYIERLAYEYGFSSASHFSRAFHEQYGYAPRDALHHPAHQGLVHAPERDRSADFRASLDALSR